MEPIIVFQSLLQYLQFDFQCNNLVYSLVRTTTAAITLLGIVHAVTASFIFGFGLGVFSTPKWDPFLLWNCLKLKTKKVMFLIETDKCHENFVVNDGSDIFGILMGLLGAFGVFCRRVNGLYEELMLCMGTLAFWLSAKSFVMKIRSMTSFQYWPEVYREYLKLKKYGDLTNRAFGLLYLLYTLTALFYYSINLDKFLTSHDLLVRLKYSVYYINLVSTFVLAADINKRVSFELELWISQNVNEESISIRTQNQLTLILHEITNNRIGMSGYYLFTVTYSIAAQMASILITYFIICVQ
ncbi:unnamed protein product [Orchesella dallaii]|uniref:Gustatory receptor n=1 Tax=Orchesella dallaii TaxID=48710 RepID=A0ABP1RDD1_9HEXA